MPKQLPAQIARTKDPAKLKDYALSQRESALTLRKELSSIKAEVSATDWIAEAFAAGATVAGAASVGALRGFGLTDGREHLEPIAAVALGFTATRIDSPALLSFAVGVASRFASEKAEDAVADLRAAMRERRGTSPAPQNATPATSPVAVAAAVNS